MRSRSRVGARPRRRPLPWLCRALMLAPLLLAAGPPATALAYDDAGYLAYADRMQERLDALWDERERPVPAGARRRRCARQRAAAADPQRRGAAGPHRARSQRPSRAPDRARAGVAAGLHRAPVRPPRRGLPDPCARVDELDVERRRGPAPRVRRRDRRRARARLEGAPRARAVRRDGREDRRPHPSRRVVALLALADDPPQPGQLVRADVRRRRDGDRPPGPPAARPAQAARPLRGGRNFGAGLRFQYLPHLAPYARANLDSAEYANIVLSFLRFYNQARRAGMAPLSRAGRGLVRRWERRVIAGYWTHGGYLNWDTGLGFERWHQAKKLGLAQQALIGIAQARRLQPSSANGGGGRSGCSTAGCASTSSSRSPRAGCPTPVLFKLFTVPQGDRQRAPRRRAAAGQRCPRGRGRARAHAVQGPEAALRL